MGGQSQACTHSRSELKYCWYMCLTVSWFVFQENHPIFDIRTYRSRVISELDKQGSWYTLVDVILSVFSETKQERSLVISEIL